MDPVGKHVADAVLGIDTLWGGDVMCASGTGRFIADSWFSDEPLPATYTCPAAARLRASGGVTGKDSTAVSDYVREMGGSIVRCLDAIGAEARRIGGLRGAYLEGLNISLTTMWALALEVTGKGNRVSYEESVEASTGRPPEPSDPTAKRARIAELLGRAGYKSANSTGLLQSVDAWRKERISPMASVRALGAAVIAQFDTLSAENLLPYLPTELAPCREPTSISLPSRMHGFPDR